MPKLSVKSQIQLRREEPYRRAVAQYELILAQDPHNLEALLGLGRAQMHLREYNDVLGTMHQALEIAPDSAEVHFVMGSACYMLKAHSQAYQHLRTAVALGPNVGKYHARLGACLFQRWPEKALTHVDAAFRLDPASLGLHPRRVLWRARIFAGAAPNLWLAFWAGFAFVFTFAGWQRGVPSWFSQLISPYTTRGLGSLIRIPFMSAPYVAAIAVQLHRRRYRRAVWAFLLWVLWGFMVYLLPIW